MIASAAKYAPNRSQLINARPTTDAATVPTLVHRQQSLRPVSYGKEKVQHLKWDELVNPKKVLIKKYVLHVRVAKIVPSKVRKEHFWRLHFFSLYQWIISHTFTTTHPFNDMPLPKPSDLERDQAIRDIRLGWRRQYMEGWIPRGRKPKSDQLCKEIVYRMATLEEQPWPAHWSWSKGVEWMEERNYEEITFSGEASQTSSR